MKERLNTYEAVVAKHKERLKLGENQTLAEEYKGFHEEVAELSNAVYDHIDQGTPETAREVGQEAADIFIRLLQITHLAGYDFERAVNEKLEVMHQKYTEDQASKLKSEGLIFEDRMKVMKQQWKTK